SILDELLRSKVDILLAVGTVVTQAAQRATAMVPLVLSVGDPVGSGFAKSLARPGGNITGLALQLTDEFSAKRLELLKEAVPGARRGGYICSPRGRRAPGEPLQRSAATLQIALVPIDVRGAQDFDGVLRTIRQQRVDALMTDGDPLTGGGALRPIADIAATQRLPSIHISAAFVEGGGGVDELRPEPLRGLATNRRLCRPHPEGREARRPPRRAANEVRVRDQSQDRQGSRPHNPAVAADAGGRDHPVTTRRAFLGSLAGGLVAGGPASPSPGGGAGRH